MKRQYYPFNKIKGLLIQSIHWEFFIPDVWANSPSSFHKYSITIDIIYVQINYFLKVIMQIFVLVVNQSCWNKN